MNAPIRRDVAYVLIGKPVSTPDQSGAGFFRDMRWQIVKHRPDGSAREGGFRTFELGEAPPALIDIAVAREDIRAQTPVFAG